MPLTRHINPPSRVPLVLGLVIYFHTNSQQFSPHLTVFMLRAYVERSVGLINPWWYNGAAGLAPVLQVELLTYVWILET